jgi:hypothetical protein
MMFPDYPRLSAKESVVNSSVELRCSLRSLVIGSPWPSPARGEGKCFSSASSASCQGVESSCLFAPSFDPCIPSPLAGEGRGEGV